MSVLVVILRISFVLICLLQCTFAGHIQFTNRQKFSEKSITEFRNGTFDERINGTVKEDEEISYVFHYDFYRDQPWAVYVCVRSIEAKDNAPLLVVVRQSLYVMSWSVPMQFDVKSFKHTEVCHTLCPLGNFFKKGFSEGPEEIYVDFSTSSSSDVKFELLVFNFTSFLVKTDAEITLHLTPTEPKVLEYHMPKGVNSVLIEASSPTESCMILAIQDIQCPFYDSERTVEYKGFYQTMTLQSGITVTEKFFKEREVYIVMILKPSDGECQREEHIDEVGYSGREKTVKVKVTPSLSDKDFYIAVGGAFGVYILLYVFSFIICCFLYVKKRRMANFAYDITTVSSSSPSVQTYGAICVISEETVTNHSIHETCGSAHSIHESYTAEDQVDRQISLDETDFDKLPDAERDKNVVRTKTVLYVADLARKNERYLSERTKIYSWNLLTIAIFYGLPVVQLVYINQKVVNFTGNQDLCYYNFLCSHKLWAFSDFNHIYSNIGYVMLGILFLLLTWRRECLVGASSSKDEIPIVEPMGIPHHFGLFYAMGSALVMEGVLSASYHVCPNKANFQFDTAFMYIIATVCILKLYQARHPDITAKSHHTWMILSVVLLIGVVGVWKGTTFFWVVFIFAHIIITFLVSTTIYYMGRWKLDRGLFKRICVTFNLDIASRSFRPMYMGRFLMLAFAVCLNIALDLFGLIKQPANFAAFLLAIFIINLLLYLVYYTMMKIRSKERIRWIPIMYMLLSFLCWSAALHFFLLKNTSWQLTPALSRERNKHCVLLNFYDDHDVWHFLSSCALFFAYMVLFTLDDDLENTPRSSIIVF